MTPVDPLLTTRDRIMSGSDTSNTRLVLEILKVSADGALALAGGTQNRLSATDDAKLILGVLKNTAAGALSVARTAETAATVAASNTDTAMPAAPTGPLVKISPVDPARLREVGDGPFVINERVGSVSQAAWDALSEERLKELDVVLKRIVGKVCGISINWDEVGSRIQKEFAAFGLEFATATYFTDTPEYWVHSGNTNSSDLERVHAARLHARKSSNGVWYSDEMFRIVQRLMELRGFQI